MKTNTNISLERRRGAVSKNSDEIKGLILGMSLFLFIFVSGLIYSCHQALSSVDTSGTKVNKVEYPIMPVDSKESEEASNNKSNTNIKNGSVEVYSGADDFLDSSSPSEETIDESEYTIDSENWVPPGAGRYAEYKDGRNEVELSDEDLDRSDALARYRREAVKNAMKHAWTGYKTHAWGKDELQPVTKKSNNRWGGMGTTLVDALDTLWLMDMKEEFWEARDWVRDSLSHSTGMSVSVFETTIRSLGGLLSAYDLSGDTAFLNKAEDLGSKLFKAFPENGDGMPSTHIRLNGKGNASIRGSSNIAEVGTLQVEFRYLSKALGDPKYAQRSEKVFELLQPLQSQNNGLFPYGINRQTPVKFTNSNIRFGAMADSFYEYMLKVWLQGGKKESMYREMYDYAMDGLHEKLILKTSKDGLTYIAELNSGRLNHKMDHLACFMAGSLALGAYTHPDGLDSPKAQRDLETGKALAYTCYQMYASNPTGIGPEIAKFPKQDHLAVDNGGYILRPETVESFFILNYLTGDPTYREWGWEVFQSIEKYCKTSVAYGGVKNVEVAGTPPQDSMESFFLAETMKYLYLLFDPDTEIDILEKHVFNTEAHPVRIFPVIDGETY